MVPPGLVQDRQNAVTAQAMTNRAHVSPELSGNYRNPHAEQLSGAVELLKRLCNSALTKMRRPLTAVAFFHTFDMLHNAGKICT
jgi:hypothetical protein